jgi:hypothetical protein
MLTACAQFNVNEKIWMHPGYAVMAPKAMQTLDDGTGYHVDSVYFKGQDGTPLHGLLLTRAGNRVTVLYFGGDSFQTGDSGLEVGQLFESVGVDALLVDYRGYGGSEGHPSISALQSDALAAYDYLRAEGATAGTEILVHGFSLGSMIAPYVAMNRPVDGLTLESTATDAKEWAENAVPWYFTPFVHINIDASVQHVSNTEALRRYHGPLILFVGADDDITPPKFSEALYRLSPTPQALKAIYIAKGRGHGEVFLDAGAQKEYVGFINDAVLKIPGPADKVAQRAP